MKHLLLLCLVCLGFCQCARNTVTGRKQLMLIRPEMLYGPANQSFLEEIEQNQLCNDPAVVQLVDQVTSRLIMATEAYLKGIGKENEARLYNWKVAVINSPVINATCRPGGKIIVYTGIFKIAPTPDALAAVLGHEITHALSNHGAERVSQELATKYTGAALELATSNQDPQFQEMVSTFYKVGTNYGFLLPYSRKHEKEADLLGLNLMTLAGFNPEAAPKLWYRMVSLTGQQGPELLSTHPASKKRAQYLEQAIPEAKNFANKYKAFMPVAVPSPGISPSRPSGIDPNTTTLVPSKGLNFLYGGNGTMSYDTLSFQSTAPKLSGRYYRVQICQTTTADLGKFNAYKPLGDLYVEQIRNRENQVNYRILTGYFTSLESAKKTREEAKRLGALNPAVIEYRDGNRCTWFQL